jgi:PAS domain S-box-containing protein
MKAGFVRGLAYLAAVPAAIAVLWTVSALWIEIPNPAAIVVLVVVYCAYRAGLGVGLAAAALQVLYAWVLLSDPDHLFSYSHVNLVRAVLFTLVSPAMATMVGLLRRQADYVPVLRKREQRLNLAQRGAGIGTVELDLKTGSAEWSDETYRIYGVDPTSFTPTTEAWLALVASEDRERMRAVRQDLSAGTRPPSTEYRIVRPGGETRLLRAQFDMLADGAGRPKRLIKTIRDITERRATEQQLAQAQKMEAIGNLTGGLAHDFNNLLGVIIGNLAMVSESPNHSAEDRELVKDAYDAARRGADLTRRLLAFARRQPLKPERTDANELVAGITALLRRALGANIEIDLNLAPGLWPVRIDPAQLESAITNLSTNARDSMPEGGKLIIRTANTVLDQGYAAVNANVRPGDYILIEVCDTGAGMPPEIQAQIFEPFFTTKEVGKGTGLGLSMVFGFIKQSGGHISVYSELGKGTCFRLYLPRSLAQGEEVEARRTGEQAEPHGVERVLVVEDNVALRRVVAKQLSELGYRVLEAQDGATALALLRRNGVDLLFTDVVMPGEMSGIALARAAAALAPEIKVLFTSGFPEARVRNGAWLSKEAKLLSKPYRKDELARALRAVLDAEIYA